MGSGTPPTEGRPSITPLCPSRAREDLSQDVLLALLPRDEARRPVLGRIPLECRIGKGGMGSVYYAVHPRLNVEVAIKILPQPMVESDPKLVDRFVAEARMAAALSSDHVVRVLDVDCEGTTHFLVMEYVDGESAGAYLKRRRQPGAGIPEREALEIVAAAARGLAAAHARGIIHRDIKPDNILIPRRADRLEFSGAKLADLGLAKPEDAGTSLGTQSHVAMGTPGFMAPEQAEDSRTAGPPADVFSMGATLYTLLCGERPFRGSSLAAVLRETCDRPPPPLPEFVSGPVRRLVIQCLEKDPARRCPDGMALLRSIESLGNRPAPPRPATRRAVRPPATPPARSAVPWIAASAAVLAIASIILVLVSRARPAPAAPPPPPARTADPPPPAPVPELYQMAMSEATDARRLGDHERLKAALKWALEAKPGDPAAAELLGRAMDELYPRELRLMAGVHPMEFRRIDPGVFVMGDAAGEPDESPREVAIGSPYWMQVTEVTQAQWEAVMGANASGTIDPAHPVNRVSWDDCVEFVRRLNQNDSVFRAALPTEAEWEYACRAGSRHRWSCGDDPSGLAAFARFGQPPAPCGTRKVASLRPNAWGLFDMHGNVFEWCHDRYRDGRALRGGSWADKDWLCRSGARNWMKQAPDVASWTVGCRLVLHRAPRRIRVPLDARRTIHMDFVLIPAGRFKAGDYTIAGGTAPADVSITRDFWMAETEVTQRQWNALMGSNPSAFPGENRPVDSVSWDDCQQFIGRLNTVMKETRASLPTEAEWEYAARAGTTTLWSFGDQLSDADAHAWFDANASSASAPVRGKKPNRWGLYDMHGNVWEWCQDRFALATPSGIDPAGPDSGVQRIQRGGSWYKDALATRSGVRNSGDPAGRSSQVGFRVVLR